jgi:hypothetical protein
MRANTEIFQEMLGAKNVRKMVLVLLAGAAIMPVAAAQADTRQDIIDNAARCGALSDDRQWLDCFYGSAQPMRSRLGLAPASEAQIRLSGSASVVSAPKSERAMQGFGAPPPKPLAINNLSAKLVKYTLDSHGQFTVTLDNGQVWRQQSGDTAIAHWNPEKSVQYVIVINSGFLGSYNLAVQGQPERFKVERLQ